MIRKIKFKNYKKFKDNEIFFIEGRNVLVGENGVGKSTVIEAICMVMRGSTNLVQSKGISNLFNIDAIKKFNIGDKKIEELPELYVELYFDQNSEANNAEVCGSHNLDNDKSAFGICMKIIPNDDYTLQIKEQLESAEYVFPFEFYKVVFQRFDGSSYNTYAKGHTHSYSLLNSSVVSVSSSLNKLITKTYINSTTEGKRKLIQHDFRSKNDNFSDALYSKYKLEVDAKYKLKIKEAINFAEEFITIHSNGLDISNLGEGEKLMIAIESNLSQEEKQNTVTLIEEPETHLSYINMEKLICMIENNANEQIIIATHSNMIVSRLGVINTVLLSENGIFHFVDVNEETSKFFQKAPNTNLLNFILSKKCILVEGDAEYILMEKFYEMETGKKLSQDDISIIACGGKTFKRYSDIARGLNKRVAIVTDNDKNYDKNITKNYSEIINDNVKVFSDNNDENWTFEVSLYSYSKTYIDNKLYTKQMGNGVVSFMLNNKAESAFRLLVALEDESDQFTIPTYIKEAIAWIKS
ncbi:AAA family ATPase [[Clostridium] innocuum]|nr:AAA family ATPase [[Clostridium] innocuum]MCR0579434.1 AAA family ATPase [[Clostridium] innocuum]